MKLNCFDLLLIGRIRLKYAWIRVVCWKMNMLICLSLKSEKNVLGHALFTMNLMKMIENPFQNAFDLLECVSSALHVFVRELHMYWSISAYAWQNDWPGLLGLATCV